MQTKILYLTIIILFLSGCTAEQGYIKVYFCPGECQNILIKLINESKDIDCALYNIKDKKVLNSLIMSNATKRIVSNNYIKGLKTKSRPGYKKGIMHNKFCIFDKTIVYTGSYNPNGLNYLNNVLVIKSKKVAHNYLSEFQELDNDQFGGGERVLFPVIKLNQTIIENYFCPEDDCQTQVLKELKSAKQNILFMVFSFTDKKIASTLIKKSDKVQVEGIMESSQLNKHSVYTILKDKINILTYSQGILHDKVFIIDNQTIITGSWNPTKNGSTRNDENLIIIHDSKIARLYVKRFYDIKNKH